MHYRHAICTLIIAATPLTAEAKLEVIQGRPVTKEVYVNGHGPYRFLLDTGAQTNQIDSRLARVVGLPATFEVEMVTATGSMRVPGGKGASVVLDSAEAAGQEFLFTDLRGVRQILAGIQGVLGQEFLHRFDYTLDLAGKSLKFGASDPDGTRVDFKVIDGRPSVYTSLGWLVLDSGADHVILFGGAGPARTAMLRTATGFLETGVAPAKALLVDGRTVHHEGAVTVPRQPGVAEDGLLPAVLFHSIYLSNSKGYAILSLHR